MKWVKKHKNYFCYNPRGEDTVISCVDSIRFNDSNNHGRWAISFDGAMVEKNKQIRTFRTLNAAKKVAELLNRKRDRKSLATMPLSSLRKYIKKCMSEHLAAVKRGDDRAISWWESQNCIALTFYKERTRRH